MSKCIKDDMKRAFSLSLFVFLSPVRDHFSLRLSPRYYGSMLQRQIDTLKRAEGDLINLLNENLFLTHTHTSCFSMVLRSSSPRVQASGLEVRCARIPPAK